MLKHNEVNLLAVFGLRRIDHCPPHFTPVRFDLRVHEKMITDWIWEHLDGRFYIGDCYSHLDNGNIDAQKMVAFEESSEASYFALMINTINQHSESVF